MDRPLDDRVRRSRLVRRWATIGLTVAGLAAATAYGSQWLRPSIHRSRIRTAVVERGPLEATLEASGVVVPAGERVLTSPIETRVERILKQPGSVLRPGEAILELDTLSARNRSERLADQLAQKRNERDQLRIELESRLADLQGRLASGELDLELARYRLEQHRQLFEQGLVAEEQLREAEVAVRKAEIEVRRLGDEAAAARRATDAQLEGLDLEEDMLRKQSDEARRELELATTRVSDGGVLTWVVPQPGTSVTRGAELARIADLDSFRVEATVPDVYATRLETGQRVRVLVNGQPIGGRLTTILPTIEDGTLRFVVDLDEPSHPELRHNLRVDVLVITAERDDVLLVRRGPFEQAGGRDQQVYVVEGDVARRVDVRFGLAGHRFVEAVTGLQAGDEVIISDMRDYLHASRLRLR